MIYLSIIITILSIILASLIYISVQRDLVGMEALNKRLADTETKDKKIDAEIAYLESLYGVDDYVRWHRKKG